MTMDIQNEKNNIFNFKVAKLIGLYQIIDPGTVRIRGRNIYHIVLICILVYMCFVSIIMNLCGLYNLTSNLSMSINYFWKAEEGFYLIFKIWFVIRHSDDIWNCLSITRYSFTSFGNRYRHIQDHWRNRLIWLTTIYIIVVFFLLIINVLIGLTLSDDLTALKNYDGSIGYYRHNAFNLYFMISDETYNSNYYMFWLNEELIIFLAAILFSSFDILLISICFGINCQMQVICSALESAGHKSNFPNDNQAVNMKTQPNKHSLIYDELKNIIMDHQLIMDKYEDFLNIFRRLMLFQIFVTSLTIIVLCFTFIMTFSADDRFMASNFIVSNTCCAIPPMFCQIFTVCYLFGNLNDQQDAIIFALYSSNWTEMDMKCKKLILLTMKLNNANNKKLKFTLTKIVNLEMFFKTMRDCYSVISVLVNYIQEK